MTDTTGAYDDMVLLKRPRLTPAQFRLALISGTVFVSGFVAIAVGVTAYLVTAPQDVELGSQSPVAPDSLAWSQETFGNLDGATQAFKRAFVTPDPVGAPNLAFAETSTPASIRPSISPEPATGDAVTYDAAPAPPVRSAEPFSAVPLPPANPFRPRRTASATTTVVAPTTTAPGPRIAGLRSASVAPAPAAPVDNRGFFERLFDAKPSDAKGPNGKPGETKAAGVKPSAGPALAYARPDDGGFFGSLTTPNPAVPAPNGDARTAIYDIQAHVVYMPNGAKLEAHSGLGPRMDDPGFVHVKDRGATPPHVYDLSLREELFHGVQALRLNPVDGRNKFNRTGLLAHSFMLGPNGDSNGCVSFRDYPQFLAAFMRGEVKRLVVVSHMSAPNQTPARFASASRT